MSGWLLVSITVSICVVLLVIAISITLLALIELVQALTDAPKPTPHHAGINGSTVAFDSVSKRTVTGKRTN